MKNFFTTLLILALLSPLLRASDTGRGYKRAIDSRILQRMKRGGSWRRGCPVAPKDLRYLRIPYRDFHGKREVGEMIVHKSVADEVLDIFAALYKIGYPINKMRLVSDYRASDFDSIEADNTSAFNCRNVTGGKKWSRHSYGTAIDINPIENPYISRNGSIAHKKSYRFRKRVHRNSKDPADRAMLIKGDRAVYLFKKRGWRWGGDWHSIKDYQHFDKTIPVQRRKSVRKIPKTVPENGVSRF